MVLEEAIALRQALFVNNRLNIAMLSSEVFFLYFFGIKISGFDELKCLDCWKFGELYSKSIQSPPPSLN